MKKPSIAQVFLLLAAFLAPIVGGQINTEATSLAADPMLLLRSIFSGFDSILTYFDRAYQPPPAIETPTLSHALIALLVAGAAILVFAKRRVFQVPLLRVSIPLMLFFGWMLCTIAFSSFTTISLVAAAEWVIYGIAFYVAVAAAGRRRGSFYVIVAIVAGCTLVAFKGLFEYGAERSFDPTWRVFSTWANPTSLAGMMTIGMILALGLSLYIEDIPAVIPWTCALAMGSCIMVTDSRGGIFSMLVGMICLAGFATFWSATKEQKRANLLKLGAVFVFVLAFGRWVHPVAGSSHSTVASATKSGYVLAGQTTTAPAATPAVTSTQEGEQSSGFRILLWKGAAHLMVGNPIGSGIGTYRFVSAKPGLTTETQLAHNTYLQIGVETGFLGLLFFLAFLGIWLYEVVRGCYAPLRPNSMLRLGAVIVAAFLALEALSRIANVVVFPTTTLKIGALAGVAVVWLYVEMFRKPANLTTKQNILRAAIIAAIIGMLFDNMLESGLYSFGVGVCTFLLLGVGLVQAADGVAPEFIPKLPRALACLASVFAGLLVLHAGVVEMYRSRARDDKSVASASGGFQTLAGQQALELANKDVDSALNLVSFIDQEDGESWRIKASVAGSAFESVEDYKKAAEYHPNTRNLRAVAMAASAQHAYSDAIEYCLRALETDPNNLSTLALLRDSYSKDGQYDKAMETAQRLVAIEGTPYFTVRSLPQIIPTETYEAHAYIAANSKDPAVVVSELEKSVAGYQLYLANTVPLLLQMAKGDPGNANAAFGGENLSGAQFKMREAASIAQALGDEYRKEHRIPEAYRTTQIEKQFAAAAGPSQS